MKNALQEILPRKVRLWLYVLVSFVALVLGSYQASEGNWFLFIAGVVIALQGSLAATDVVGDPDLQDVRDEKLMEELDRRVNPEHEVPQQHGPPEEED